jgi:FAD/FMN-containing dehydrogenase
MGSSLYRLRHLLPRYFNASSHFVQNKRQSNDMCARNLRSGSEHSAFEPWGRYPRLPARLLPLYWTSEFPLAQFQAEPQHGTMLPVGLGRSYGDVCLLENGTLLHTVELDRFIDFDPVTGLLRCEAGISLAEILKFAVPRGWFLPVTPGTKFVTLGGAIANDIHGRNQHLAGSIGRHVPRFELVRSDGVRIECSSRSHPEWYAATIGGMGLTGLISWAELQLRPIVSRKIDYRSTQFRGIDEFVALSQAAQTSEYSSAWIDCASQGKNFARGVFTRGDHSPTPGVLKPSFEFNLPLPFDFPEFLLNRFTAEAVNSVLFHKQFVKEKTGALDYEFFFYPLDRLLHANRIYGNQGMLQFHCLLPLEDGQHGILRILKAIVNSGLASPSAAIQLFGDQPSPGMMSFPAAGISVAVDFPIRREATFDLLERLAYMTVEHRGRMYPAKDARMKALQFQAFYPQWHDFARYIDPAFSSNFWRRVSSGGAAIV